MNSTNPQNQLIKLKWFTFHQNNSGGHFTIDGDVNENVIIQAQTASEANELAERIGIYFDGVENGQDCQCCGNRWSPQYSGDDGTDEPEVYGEKVPWCPDSVLTSGAIKVYPYCVLVKR